MSQTATFSPEAGVPAPKKGGLGCFWSGCLGSGCLVVLVCCGGFGGLAYYGMGEMNKQTKQALAANPVIQEHLGDVVDARIDWSRTINEEEAQQFIVHVEGTKASGTVKSPFAGGPDRIDEGVLIMADGTEIPLSEEEVFEGPIIEEGEAQEIEIEREPEPDGDMPAEEAPTDDAPVEDPAPPPTDDPFNDTP